MLKFVSDHLKTKKLCKHAVEKLPFLIRYVSDHYKIQQMCDKTISENSGTLKSVFLTATKINSCVIKQLTIPLMH